MAMSRARKEDEIKAYGERFANDEMVVVVRNNGLTVSEMTAYRKELLENGASFKVTKNTLAKIALKGSKFEHITDLFAGPVGVATSQDAVAAAKVTHKYAKEYKNLEIVGGALGKMTLDQAGVEQLASLPSLDELRGKLVGLLQAPAQKVVGVIQAPAGQLARVTRAYATKGE